MTLELPAFWDGWFLVLKRLTARFGPWPRSHNKLLESGCDVGVHGFVTNPNHGTMEKTTTITTVQNATELDFLNSNLVLLASLVIYPSPEFS